MYCRIKVDFTKVQKNFFQKFVLYKINVHSSAKYYTNRKGLSFKAYFIQKLFLVPLYQTVFKLSTLVVGIEVGLLYNCLNCRVQTIF